LVAGEEEEEEEEEEDRMGYERILTPSLLPSSSFDSIFQLIIAHSP